MPLSPSPASEKKYKRNKTRSNRTNKEKKAGLLVIRCYLDLRSSANLQVLNPNDSSRKSKVSKEDLDISTWRTKMTFASDRVPL